MQGGVGVMVMVARSSGRRDEPREVSWGTWHPGQHVSPLPLPRPAQAGFALCKGPPGFEQRRAPFQAFQPIQVVEHRHNNRQLGELRYAAGEAQPRRFLGM